MLRPRLSAVLLLTALGCAALPRPFRSEPFSVVVERPNVVLHSDKPLGDVNNLLAEVAETRASIQNTLRVNLAEQPVHIYLFDDEDSYAAFVRQHFPQFPYRRALFVESTAELAVYAHRGPNLLTDLRHEATHGYLHATYPNLPLWLDEGLAEYFEVGPSAGEHPQHAATLQAAADSAGWRPDLARLEALTDAGAMTQLEYAESWAWARWLIQNEPQTLAGFLADPNARRLSSRPAPAPAATATQQLRR